jgi:hypothetical protein
LADGYHALEFGIFERMILGTCGRTFFEGIHRGIGHRPGYKHSMDRESEVMLQSIAFLDNKDTPATASCRAQPAGSDVASG